MHLIKQKFFIFYINIVRNKSNDLPLFGEIKSLNTTISFGLTKVTPILFFYLKIWKTFNIMKWYLSDKILGHFWADQFQKLSL
jgi:hypothetical protein